VYCGADMAENSKGCCSDAEVWVIERKEARKAVMVSVPRIFVTCLVVCQMFAPARCSKERASEKGKARWWNCLNSTQMSTKNLELRREVSSVYQVKIVTKYKENLSWEWSVVAAATGGGGVWQVVYTKDNRVMGL
jgi:hypothetical protein